MRCVLTNIPSMVRILFFTIHRPEIPLLRPWRIPKSKSYIHNFISNFLTYKLMSLQIWTMQHFNNATAWRSEPPNSRKHTRAVLFVHSALSNCEIESRIFKSLLNLFNKMILTMNQDYLQPKIWRSLNKRNALRAPVIV